MSLSLQHCFYFSSECFYFPSEIFYFPPPVFKFPFRISFLLPFTILFLFRVFFYFSPSFFVHPFTILPFRFFFFFTSAFLSAFYFPSAFLNSFYFSSVFLLFLSWYLNIEGNGIALISSLTKSFWREYQRHFYRAIVVKSSLKPY